MPDVILDGSLWHPSRSFFTNIQGNFQHVCPCLWEGDWEFYVVVFQPSLSGWKRYMSNMPCVRNRKFWTNRPIFISKSNPPVILYMSNMPCIRNSFF